MGNLSSIDEVEQERAAADAADMAAAQEAVRKQRARSVAADAQAQRPQAASAEAAAAQQAQPQRSVPGAVQGKGAPAAPQLEMTAEQEEDFHGLSDVDSMGAGQKALLVLAACVVVAAVLYVVNTYTHFIS